MLPTSSPPRVERGPPQPATAPRLQPPGQRERAAQPGRSPGPGRSGNRPAPRVAVGGQRVPARPPTRPTAASTRPPPAPTSAPPAYGANLLAPADRGQPASASRGPAALALGRRPRASRLGDREPRTVATPRSRPGALVGQLRGETAANRGEHQPDRGPGPGPNASDPRARAARDPGQHARGPAARATTPGAAGDQQRGGQRGRTGRPRRAPSNSRPGRPPPSARVCRMTSTIASTATIAADQPPQFDHGDRTQARLVDPAVEGDQRGRSR